MHTIQYLTICHSASAERLCRLPCSATGSASWSVTIAETRTRRCCPASPSLLSASVQVPSIFKLRKAGRHCAVARLPRLSLACVTTVQHYHHSSAIDSAAAIPLAIAPRHCLSQSTAVVDNSIHCRDSSSIPATGSGTQSARQRRIMIQGSECQRVPVILQWLPGPRPARAHSTTSHGASAVALPPGTELAGSCCECCPS